MVVGGGVAGMEAARSMADMGFQAYLVEKGDTLGGQARNLVVSSRGLDYQGYLNDLQATHEALRDDDEHGRRDEIGLHVEVEHARHRTRGRVAPDRGAAVGRQKLLLIWVRLRLPRSCQSRKDSANWLP